MKNIFKISKRGIIAILALCILLGIAGTGLNVTAMAAETTVTVEETTVTTEDITPVVVDESTISTEDTTVVTEESTQELMPMAADDCPEYVEGIGWTGSPEWYQAIATVQQGGHIESVMNNGVYLSESNARLLLDAAGVVVYGGVERDDYDHNYPHIHFWWKNSRHNSIRISG